MESGLDMIQTIFMLQLGPLSKELNLLYCLSVNLKVTHLYCPNFLVL